MSSDVGKKRNQDILAQKRFEKERDAIINRLAAKKITEETAIRLIEASRKRRIRFEVIY